MYPSTQLLNRTQLRRHYCQLRQNFTSVQQQQHALQLAEQFKNYTVFQQSKHITVYAACQGEIDPIEVVKLAWRQGKYCYLPIVQPTKDKTLLFALFTPDTQLHENHLHILEPVTKEPLYPASAMDLILVPVVAFDERGNRLGMGGGYYDLTLSFKGQEYSAESPYVVGLAHELQKIERLKPEAWDIPLHAVATETTIYKFYDEGII
jgi:5-formyltetrahydrofolate cyclo-ligase